MTLHLIKLCVGADSIEDLAQWQKGRLAAQRKAGKKPRLYHATFQTPKRQEELLENLRSLASFGQRSSPPRTARVPRAELPQNLPAQKVPPEVARLQPALGAAERPVPPTSSWHGRGRGRGRGAS